MAVKLSGSVTALFQSLRSESQTNQQQQHQKSKKRGGVWAQLNCARKLCFSRDPQQFLGRIAGLAVGTLPKLNRRKPQASCALSSFELDDVDVRRETGDAWNGSSGTTKQVPKSVHYRTTCNFQKSSSTSLRVPTPAQTFASPRPRKPGEQEETLSRQTQRRCMPQPRDTPPKRDTGIASEKDWGINLNKEIKSESGVNEDGSSWYSDSGEDLGENGYRCRWTVMGGRSADGSSEWKEAWWEKSDWTGYKELGAEKSGKNAQGDTWWETWQEVLKVDELSNLARIEKSAQKQAKSGTGSAGWFEKWWEKYNAKGWSEKGAHKYGRLNDQGWWEKWEEQYDGRGAVLKWTDKWAESDTGTKWGDKWEEKFDHGVGTRQGETWHNDEKGWSRTWGEEHYGNGKVHKYGRSTSGENWDNIVEEGTYYQAEPHYGWADAIGNSVQLLSIEPRSAHRAPFLAWNPSKSQVCARTSRAEWRLDHAFCILFRIGVEGPLIILHIISTVVVFSVVFSGFAVCIRNMGTVIARAFFLAKFRQICQNLTAVGSSLQKLASEARPTGGHWSKKSPGHRAVQALHMKERLCDWGA